MIQTFFLLVYLLIGFASEKILPKKEKRIQSCCLKITLSDASFGKKNSYSLFADSLFVSGYLGRAKTYSPLEGNLFLEENSLLESKYIVE